MKCDVWKPCSDQPWQDKLWFSIWRFFEQSTFVNNRQLCYWLTIHNSISKICPKFQVLSSQFFKVNELFNEHWAKIVRKWKNSNVCRMWQDVLIKGLRSRILVFRVWPWYTTSHPRTTILHAKKLLQVAKHYDSTSNISFFYVDWHEPMA